MKLNLIALIVLAGTLMISCTKGSNNNDTATTTAQDLAVESSKPEEVKKVDADQATNTTKDHPADNNILQAGNPAAGWDKKIIKTANVTLELKDYKSYNAAIHNKLKTFGAYIAGEEQIENDGRVENVMTIKVPVSQFEDLMNSFAGEGIKVVARRISTEDVISEVVDTKARIDAKKQVRARYLELLKQAKNMEEILQVQNEINSIQEALETADGRLKYLTQQSAFSTVHLTYYQYQNGVTVNSGQPGFFTKLQEAFSNGGYIVKSAILFMVTIWPLILGGFLFWFMIRKWRQNSIQSIKKV